ncbi:11823_t:CDS:2, partial [Acaulospora colombiana]
NPPSLQGGYEPRSMEQPTLGLLDPGIPDQVLKQAYGEAGTFVNEDQVDDTNEVEINSPVGTYNGVGTNRRPRIQLLRERKRSQEEVAMGLFAKETDINWRERTEERMKLMHRDSNHHINTYMEVVREHWRALPQEQKDGFLSRARDIIANPTDRDPKKENAKIIKKFRDLARVARDKHSVASF